MKHTDLPSNPHQDKLALEAALYNDVYAAMGGDKDALARCRTVRDILTIGDLDRLGCALVAAHPGFAEAGAVDAIADLTGKRLAYNETHELL